MNKAKNLITVLLIVLPASVLGAFLMMEFDQGGTRWLKFVLYVAMFVSIFSPAFLSSRFSCSLSLRRSRK